MKEFIYNIKIIVEPDGDGFYGYCPGLPGVFACGDTEEEAFRNAKDGAEGILRARLTYGDEIIENQYLKKLESSGRHLSKDSTQINISNVVCL